MFALPIFYLFADMDDAPGVVFVGVGVTFGARVNAVICDVLQRLLQEAIQIKEENDFTV